MVSVEIITDNEPTTVSGTLIRGETRLIRVDQYWVDIVLSGGDMLFTYHTDSPGLIGSVGTICGEHDINISFMEVGRLAPRGRAMMVIGLDDPISNEVLQKILAIPNVGRGQLVRI